MSSITSVAQPSHRVQDDQLLPELPGSLTDLREVDDSEREFTELFIGRWQQLDGSKTAVAVKRFKNIHEDTDRFGMRIMKHAGIWKDVTHPNILRFIGYEKKGKHPLLVSPWCQHGKITEFIEKNPGLTDIQKLELLCGAARGLAYLHSHTPPIVHGNIAPQSVVVQDNLEAGLCDPRLSIVLASQRYALSYSANWIGPAYRYHSEQFFLMEPHVTTFEDVYGFGGLILVTMSGKAPFWAMSLIMGMQAIVIGQTPSPLDHPGLPEADPLWNFFRTCWSRDPKDRPTSKTVLQKVEFKPL